MTGKEIKQKLNHYGVTPYQLSKQYGIAESNFSRLFNRNEKVSHFARGFFTLLFEKLEKGE